MGKIILARIYDHEQPAGYRILVDRVWPRGRSKQKAALDDWAKNIGPSTELRKWFNHEDEKFSEFSQRYCEELTNNPATVDFIKEVKEKLAKGDIVFLYGAKNKKHNQAVVLKKYIENKLD